MYKLLFLSLCILTCISCQKEKEYTSKLCRVVVNNTNKDLCLTTKIDVGSDELYSIENDSVFVIFEKKHTVSAYPYEHAGLRNDPVCVEKETLYNLTDTTQFIFTTGFCNYPNESNNEKDSIYLKNLSFNLAENSTDANPFIIATLNVTNSILQIMEKDYNMLNIFKEYYK